MAGLPAAKAMVKHLTDVNIAKILGLAKGNVSQRNIASIMKCSRKTIQHTLVTYLFETFQGINSRREYKRKTTKQEDEDIIRVLKQNYDVPLRDITNIIGLPTCRKCAYSRNYLSYAQSDWSI